MEKIDTKPAIDARSRYLLTTYALPRFGASLVLYLQGYTTNFIYTRVFSLSGTLTGISLFVGYLAIAIAQFSMGTISDHTNTRWGRRRPYVLFGAPFLLVSFFLLFTPQLFLGNSIDEMSLFAWLLIWNSGFEVFYGLVTTPYQSMLPEITAVEKRPKASMIQNIFGMIGTAAGVIMVFVVLNKPMNLVRDTKQLNLTYVLIFLVIAIAAAVFFLLFCQKMPREEPKYGSHESIINNLKQCVRNRNFLHMTIFMGIVSLIPTSSLALGYVQDVLHFTTTTFIMTAGVLLGCVLLFFILWRKSIEKRGKKATLNVILIFGMFIFPLSLVGVAQGASQDIINVLGIIFIALLAIYIAGWSLFPYILYADLTEDDARRTNNFKAGVYTGFPSIPLNIFQGISILITGILTDYLPILIPAHGSVDAVSWYYVLWGPISTGYLILSVWFLRKWVIMDFDWEKQAKLEGTKYEPGMVGGESKIMEKSLVGDMETRMKGVSAMIENADYDGALAALAEIRDDAGRENLPAVVERANDRIDTIQMLKEKESKLAYKDEI